MNNSSGTPTAITHSDLRRRVELAETWIAGNTVSNAGICRTSRHRVPYPEVSGYYIPTLLAWGRKELALQFGRWLASEQNEDGSWSDYLERSPYTFDTGQALRGLIALVDEHEEFDRPIGSACEFIAGRIESSGRVTTPDKSLWQDPYPIPELIHLYALAPLLAASRRLKLRQPEAAASRAIDYYLEVDDLTGFNSMSHFHAYVIEGLVDLGYCEHASRGMLQVKQLQDELGYVPALPDITWCCSTGLLQYSVIWYKLGMREAARRALSYACTLQNESGGFFGGYGEGADYHPDEEISWGVKFFLDAAYRELGD